MPRSKDGVNRSQAVREVLASNPTLTANEVIAALAKKGIRVKQNLVYFVKGKMKGRKGRRRKMQEAVAAVSGPTDALSVIRKVKTLAVEVGGIKKLKALVEVLSE